MNNRKPRDTSLISQGAVGTVLLVAILVGSYADSARAGQGASSGSGIDISTSLATGWRTETVKPPISYFGDVRSSGGALGLKYAYKVNTIYLPIVTRNVSSLTITLGQPNIEQGLYLDYGGDVDTEVIWLGNPPVAARRTGNGTILPGANNNQIADAYMGFRVDDNALFAGSPTTRVSLEIEYLDQGTDTFNVQYDATSGGPFGNGRYVSTRSVVKTNTGQFKKATFILCGAYFANRDNGGDFRIDDRRNGAETIRRVSVTLRDSGPAIINVDAFGANPWDTNPDSDAIQAAMNQACNGDTVVFTSGVNTNGYQGYRIDKTIFLVATEPRQNLTITSTDASNRALLQATADLKGFVVHLLARSQIINQGDVDNITVSHLKLDGGRGVRRCFGSDGSEDGLNDNWGSWLPECTQVGDAWCRAGTMAMDGAFAGDDATQDYQAHPSSWTTGLMVDDVHLTNTECGTALSFFAAGSTIQGVSVETAGEHVHRSGCTLTDNDEGVGGWSDGLTLMGPGLVITNNVVTDPSDVGIVFFGGKNTVIANNTVQATAGDHGMFAGIGIHPWGFGDVSGLQVVGNQVENNGSSTCGGIHVGIDVGTHMWGGGCVANAAPGAIGNNTCVAEPVPPSGTLCTQGGLCQEWAHVAAGKTLTLSGNTVAGAHVNYVIEGVDRVGELVVAGNTSNAPRSTDWQAAQYGCTMGGVTDFWGLLDWVAHHPAIPGWTDKHIHCPR